MKRIFFLVITAITGTILLAQEKDGGTDIKVNINEEGSKWYSSPWVWVIVAAVFILLLVALTRSRKE